jgi:FkbM family methyltransferase
MKNLFGRADAASREGLPLLTLADYTGPLDRPGLEAAIRRRCQVVNLGGDTALCRVLGRYKFLVDTRDEGLAPHLLLDGYWEFWVTHLIANGIRPGQVVYDVGANLGYYAVLMAELAGPSGHVHAVEPNPRLADLTRRNLALNGFTSSSTVHRVLATDRSGDRFRFQADMSDPKNGRIVPEDMPSPDAHQAILDISVPSQRLDDIAEGPAHFVKIDVEGAEEAAWDGMQGLIARSPDIVVLLEFNAQRCKDGPAMLRDIAAGFPLRELGYDAVVRDVAAREVLSRTEDTMLYLSRGM